MDTKSASIIAIPESSTVAASSRSDRFAVQSWLPANFTLTGNNVREGTPGATLAGSDTVLDHWSIKAGFIEIEEETDYETRIQRMHR
jgi:hypothetical protein